MSSKPEVSFSQFLDLFPELKLPVTLNEEAHHIFARSNDPVPALAAEQFLFPLEEMEPDEFSEFIACFRIPETHAFHAVVYWFAGLMSYHYVLVTFTEQGKLIDKRVIAGTFSDGKTLTTSVATIEEDWEIIIVSGQSQAEDKYDASTSTANKLELLPDGTIINLE